MASDAVGAVSLVAATPDEMVRLGQRMGALLAAGDLVLLYGDLGAGKTTLVKGIALGLGVADQVASPTFALIHLHRGRIALCHVDLYRLDSADQLEPLGLEECLEGDAVTVVEWPEIVSDWLPPCRLEVRISLAEGADVADEAVDATPRLVEITGRGARMQSLVKELANAGAGA